jgi:hypothetical protein
VARAVVRPVEDGRLRVTVEFRNDTAGGDNSTVVTTVRVVKPREVIKVGLAGYGAAGTTQRLELTATTVED